MIFHAEADDASIAREKVRARELRRTTWWKRKLEEGRCYYCARPFEASQLTMDHLVPLARGGKSTRTNCVCACKTCNSKKKYLLPIEWQEYLSSLDRQSSEEE